MKNEKKSKIRFLFIFGSFLLFLCISSNLVLSLGESNNNASKDYNTISPKKSGHWNLNNIVIDDSLTGVGAHNWTWASNQNWCSGLGTWINPYVIENVTINALNSSSGIEIKNSNKFFVIRNATVYNASALASEAGILLYYVGNGTLINNNCSFNNGIGVLLDNCVNTTIFRNYVVNNSDGISLKNSNDNDIHNNTVKYNINGGIVVQNCEDIFLSKNIVNNNSWVGIYLNNGYDHVVYNNIAKYNTYAGMRMDNSENITIRENTFDHNVEHGIMVWGNNNNNSLIDNVMKFNQA